MNMTLEKLKLMTPEARLQLYNNAKKLRHKGGQEILDLIDSAGLPLRSGGMTLDDPVYLAMEEIIWSQEGKQGTINATKTGLPALAGVEPIIVAKLAGQYHPHDMGTVSAGSIVGELMQHLGYKKVGSKPMPEGSVAKTAALWEPRN